MVASQEVGNNLRDKKHWQSLNEDIYGFCEQQLSLLDIPFPFTTSWPRSSSPTMLPALYTTRAFNHSFPLRYARSDLRSGWLCATSAFRPGWTWRPTPVQQRRCASNKEEGSSNKDKRPSRKDEKWYDWYARLHADPKASVKDLRKAYYKRAKVEHPDHDKAPGAKDRFQNVSKKPLSPALFPFH